MKKSRFLNKKSRKLFRIKEFDLIFFQLLLKNSQIPFTFKRVFYRYRISNLIFQSKIRNVCFISGNTRSFYKDFKISRVILRKLGSQGLICGIQKSS